MDVPDGLLNHFIGNDDLLYQILKHYVWERKDGWFDIYVCRIEAGPEVGTIYAIPKLTWRPAYEQYYGHGKTEDEALRDCLQKLKSVPPACVFPPLALNEHQEDDGYPGDPSYEDNGHLPKWY